MLNSIQQESINSNFYSKVKTQKTSADEFQATINKIKKEEVAKSTSSKFENIDLDLSKTMSNFIAYAQNKSYEDGLKKIEEDQLNKLFKTIDRNTKNR
ncbi:hypothetical protein [Campylobacter sp. MIT 97-5078]|uniref:hypothetical protein n=1 Tax=Campylobacter sp. MIT 97-5078 TaxID=1548153 RepID=UPI0005130FC6|nr:hypothetical protein [Campylobacter sp. MIT 97-5078]KGI55317.1 hypothetical protein LR59_12575 [Campylobacter sp. MIT 97-5078]KGI57252.1 hypothetical protein LR59_00455 [Campylobacter sp. MIT 97-5078]TQR27264.1 hypothetical protein DMB91_04505 [Campylobacter sp. MIT 97-5078]